MKKEDNGDHILVSLFICFLVGGLLATFLLAFFDVLFK